MAHVQTITKITFTNTTSSTSPTWGTNPTSGNSIFVPTSTWAASGSNVTSVTDSQSNTYNADADGTINNRSRGKLYSTHNITGGSSFTVTVNFATNSWGAWAAMEWSGLAASPLDQTGANTTTSPTDATVTASGANSQADMLVVANTAATAADTNLAYTSPASGYDAAIVVENNATDLNGQQASYKVISGSETSSCSWAHDNANTSSVIATYKISVSSTGNPNLLLLGVG